MKIALLTYFSESNTGMFFQALASIKALEATFPGAKIELVNIHQERRPAWLPNKSLPILIPSFKRNLKYANARKKDFGKYIGNKLFKRPSGTELEQYLNERDFDVVITGADTCLKVDSHWNGILPPYWIPAGVKAKKVILAGSSENTLLTDFNSSQLSEAKDAIEGWALIFARDNMTKKLIEQIAQNNRNEVKLVPDPTFSLEVKGKKNFELFNKLQANGKPLCAINIPKVGVSEELVAELQKYFSVFSLNRASVAGEPSVFLGPYEWLDMWESIDYIMTTSFHESIFAIRSGTAVIGIDITKDRAGRGGGRSKIGDLLYEANLTQLYRSMPEKNEIVELVQLLKSAKEVVNNTVVKDYCKQAGTRYVNAVRQIRELL